MADETDPCFPLRRRKKKQTHEHSSESDDEQYGFEAKNLTGNRSTSKNQMTNVSDRKTDVTIDNAPGTKPDLEIFPYYCHEEPIRGSALFVVNREFQSYEYRSGAEKDLIYLKSVFVDKLGFQQLNKGDDFDLSLSKLDDVLNKATLKNYSNTDFFVFAISTHGEERPRRSQQFEHALLCADDQYKFTMDVIKSICVLSTLAGKPKIFLIQSCRSRSDTNAMDPRKFDKGLKFTLMSKKEGKVSKPKRKDSAHADDKADANNDVDIKEEANIEDKADTKERDETHAKAGESNKAYKNNNTDAGVNTQDEADARHKNDDYRKQEDSELGGETVIPLVNIPKDCLVVYAIQSGMYAWRNSETGSWLFHELNKVMEECTSQRQLNFLDILTKTAFKMSQRETAAGYKAVPVIQHRLTKNLLIPLKH